MNNYILVILLFIFLLILIKFIFNNDIRSNKKITDKNKQYIWYYWENNGNKRPEYIDLCIESIYKNCSESFIIIELNDKNIDEYLPEVKNMDFSKLKIAQKVDFYRILLMYKYGGIYIDMDVKNLQRIDESFFSHYDLILSKMPENIIFKYLSTLGEKSIFTDIINNGIIMAQLQHQVILETINEAKKNKNSIYKNINKPLYIFITTGPLCLTNAVNTYFKTNSNNKIKIIDQSYFEGCDVFEVESGKCNIPDNAIGIHLYENSWLSTNENFMKRFFGYLIQNFIWILLTLVVLCVIIYYLITTKFLKKIKGFLFNKKVSKT